MVTLNKMKQKEPVFKKQKKFRSKLEVRHVPWTFAVLGIFLILGLRLIPSAIGVGYSFTNWTGIKLDADFIGLSNYIKIFSDPTLRLSVWNSVRTAIVLVIAVNVIGLLIALVLQTRLKYRNIYRAMFFLPFALCYLATGYVWKYILSYDGPLNQALSSLGLGIKAWTADTKAAFWCIIIVMIWQYVGFTMTIYLAGLQGISSEIHDATAIDNASPWKKFWKVTIPMLAPTITEAVSLSLIFALAAFDQITAITGGGPMGLTDTLATTTYSWTFRYGNYGRGCAFATILTILIALFTIVTNTLSRKWEEKL